MEVEAPQTPSILTSRTLIKFPDETCAEAILEYLVRNRERFKVGAPSSELPNVATISESLRRAKTDFDHGRSMRLYIFDRSGDPHEPIGDIALSEIVRGPFQASYLGYRIDVMFEGKGYMKEAVSAVVRHGFEALNLHRIMANYQPINERSGKLLRRLGFKVEGYAQDYLFLNGSWCDHILTSITNPEWR